MVHYNNQSEFHILDSPTANKLHHFLNCEVDQITSDNIDLQFMVDNC